jgi:multidrug efflux system membrane fusion protein
MDEQVDRVEFEHGLPPASQRTRVRRPWLKWLLLALCCVAIAFGLRFVLARHAARPNRQGTTATQPVGAATIGAGDIRIILNELGTVSPLDTVTVKTQINGQLTQVAFQEGQLVKKGDFLVQIDDRIYQAQLQRDQGQLAHDQGLLAQAQADLQRFETLGRQDSIAQQQVQDQRYLVQQDAGTVKADQATVATDQINIAYCHIVSPVDGRVGLRQVDPGNYVQTSDPNGIVVVTQLQPMSVVFSVPQTNLAEIEDRVAQGASLEVDAYDQSNTTQIDQGKLATIDNEMDTSTGTVKMRAVFPNNKNQLFPNEFVNAHLLVNTLTNVLRVPVPAVQLGASGTFVWVINPDNSVASRPVKLGVVDGQYQQVISGLKAGDRVVTDGTDRLRDGMKVTIPTAQSATPAGSQPGRQSHRTGTHGPRPAGGAQQG